MKTLLTFLIAGLLLGSASAATLKEIKQASIVSLSTGKIEVIAIDKKKGLAPRFNLTPIEYISALGNEGNKLHSHAWNALGKNSDAQKVIVKLRSFRTDVAALPPTAETRTFLARDLDPALAALDSVQNNPAGRTKAHDEALARLAAILEAKP